MAQFQQRIGYSTDNAYRWPGNFHNFYTGSIDLGRPFDNPGDDHEFAWLRWRNVTIPAGSIITSAYVTLARWYTSTLDVRLRIKGLDEDNTNTFSTEGDALARPLTSAYVDWNPSTSWTAETDQTSPNIASVIQEIIDRGGWASGNSIGLRIDDINAPLYSYGPFDAYTSAGTMYPQLTINYTEPAHQIYKGLQYAVKRPNQITKSLGYEIDVITQMPKSFFGVKVAKEGINVLNTNDPRHLKFSSQYNTLKYDISGHIAFNVDENGKGSFYKVSSYITHNLGYYPLAIVYAKDDLMANYQPLARFQAGSGAYRHFFFYVTTTRLYVVVSGYTIAPLTIYTVDYYYKIFKNNLNL